MKKNIENIYIPSIYKEEDFIENLKNIFKITEDNKLDIDCRKFGTNNKDIYENHITVSSKNPDENNSLIMRFFCHTNKINGKENIHDWELKLIDEYNSIQTVNSKGEYRLQLFDKNGYKIYEKNSEKTAFQHTEKQSNSFEEKFLRNKTGKEIWYENSNGVVYLNGKSDYTRLSDEHSEKFKNDWNVLIKERNFEDFFDNQEYEKTDSDLEIEDNDSEYNVFDFE